MTIDSPIKAAGHVSLYREWKDGKKELIFSGENLVVDTGKVALSRLLGGSGTGRNVDRFGIGTSGTAASVGDTALTSPNLFPATPGFPGATSVSFDFEIDYAEANGVTIREIGLVCANGALFARKVTSPIAKTSDFRLTGTWTVSLI